MITEKKYLKLSFVKNIINSIYFKRLKNISQISQLYFNNETIELNRYNHSIGVGYKSYYYASDIIKNNKNHGIEKTNTNKIIELVSIAGLLHDVGHGPFSHTFEIIINDIFNPNIKWEHENISLKIVDELYNLKIINYNAEDIKLIKNIIRGKIDNSYPIWLFEIVNNVSTNLDLDRLDYLKKDSIFLNTDMHKDLIELDNLSNNSRLNESKRIVYNESIKNDIFKIYKIRNSMFQIYYHEINKQRNEVFINTLVQDFVKNKNIEYFQNINNFIMLTDNDIVDNFKKNNENKNLINKFLNNEIIIPYKEFKIKIENKIKEEKLITIIKNLKDKYNDVSIKIFRENMIKKDDYDNLLFYNNKEIDIKFNDNSLDTSIYFKIFVYINKEYNIKELDRDLEKLNLN